MTMPPRRYRESTQESAEQAEGIFDLYGEGAGAGASVGAGGGRNRESGVGSGLARERERERERGSLGLAYRDELDVDADPDDGGEGQSRGRADGAGGGAAPAGQVGYTVRQPSAATRARDAHEDQRRALNPNGYGVEDESGRGQVESLRSPDVDGADAEAWTGPMEALSNRTSVLSVSEDRHAHAGGQIPLPLPRGQGQGQGHGSRFVSPSPSPSPRDSLGPPVAFSTPQKTHTNGSQGVANGNGDGEGADNRGSAPATGEREREGARTPLLTVTPDLTPSKRSSFIGYGHGHGHGQDDSRLSTMTASSSTGTGGTGGSLLADRLGPRTRLSIGAGSIGGASTYEGETSFSQASVASGVSAGGGSVQYPGEEADAFHVRSTYARLEAEGVFGDGWDPGVERTRGGPNVGKRATVMEQQKGSDIGEKERGYLSSVDRYGFIREPLRDRNESRLALIPAAPLGRIPKLPATSPLAGKTSVQPTMLGVGGSGGQQPPQARLPASGAREQGGKVREKELERVGKWMRMMGVKRREGGNAVEWVWKGEGESKLRRRVYKGIPDRWRMAAWWTLAEGRMRQARGRSKLAEDLGMEYCSTIDQPSEHDVQIDLDVPRTISGHTLFVTRYGAGQRSLFHVLHCFSLLCDTCGYCQGMGPIAATLLCYFDPERTHALMVRLHDLYGMHEIFAPGFPGLLEAFYVQERLMEWLMPDVYQSFQRNMISSSAWGTKWYITLFVNTVPFSTQLRLWDALWLDGRDVVVITSLAILWAFRDLLAHPSATFESILSLLSSHYVPEDEDKLLRWIKRLLHQPGVKQKMDAWRAEWAGLVKAGKEGEALL